MPEVIPWALAAWVAATLFLFWRLPGRDAALISILVGGSALPVMDYPPAVFRDSVGDGGTAHAVTIAGGVLANRAAAIGLGCLCGMISVGWPAVRRLRWGWLDAPMGIWCALPLASAMVNGLGPAEGLAQVRDQVLAWGTPYLAGRAYLGRDEDLGTFGLGLVWLLLALSPLIAMEFLNGPFLYGLVYGPHPYQIEGASRPVLWRPLVFQEHGNQFGILVVSAAVAAVWMWKAGRLTFPRRAWLPALSPGWVAASLAILALACQSHGAIALGTLALAPVALAGEGRGARRWPRVAGALLLAAGIAALVLAAATARDAGVRQRVRAAFAGLGKTSVTWRLARSEEVFRKVGERPWLGWGDRDWFRQDGSGPSNPVNLSDGLLTLGMYGGLGLLAWGAALLGPVVAALRRLPSRAWVGGRGSAVAMASVLVLLNLGDSLSNSTWLPPMTAAAGGLASWASRKRAQA